MKFKFNMITWQNGKYCKLSKILEFGLCVFFRVPEIAAIEEFGFRNLRALEKSVTISLPWTRNRPTTPTALVKDWTFCGYVVYE